MRLASAIVFVVCVVACTPMQVANTVKTIADISACVDNHLDESPEAITIACGIAVGPELIQLIESRKAERARQRLEGRAEQVSEYMRQLECH